MRYNEFLSKLEEKTFQKFTYYRIAKITGELLGTMYKRKIRNSTVPDKAIRILEKNFNIKILTDTV